MLGKVFFILAISCAAFVLFTGAACADNVILENGDTLTGTVEKMAGGKLILRTEWSAPIEIDTTKIKKISTEAPVEVHLENGEIIKGRLTSSEDKRVLVERSDDRATTAIAWKNIAAINPPTEAWHGNVTVGATSQTGNTDRMGANVAFDAVKRTKRDRFSLGYQFNYNEDQNEVTERNHYGSLKYDYFLTQRLYAYLSSDARSDTLNDLNLRLGVGPGIGYQIWDDPTKRLSFEAGLSYVNENYKEGEDKDYIALRLGGDMMYKLGTFFVFTDKLVIYPSLDDAGEYVLRNEVALSVPVTSGWSMKLANIVDRNSEPPAGNKKTDIQWILGVQYGF